MKTKDIIEAMARVLGLDAADLEQGYNAFEHDFFAQEGIAC